MPGATDTFGIAFPCESEDITLSSLQTFAEDVESAISTVNTLGTAAIAPSAVNVMLDATTQTLNAGVTATLTYDTEVYDRGSMFTLASPTLITLPSTGSYLATLKLRRIGAAGNIFSLRGAILLAGTEVASHKDESVSTASQATQITVTAFFQATAGQTVTATGLFTGSVTITTIQSLQVLYVSTV